MKSVTLYRPTTLEEALVNFDQLAETFFGDTAAGVPGHSGPRPAVDVKETEKSYFLEAELPGYDEKNVEVHVEGNVLIISSKKEEKAEKKEDAYILRERKNESFKRSFKLPDNADPNSISAGYKNGVLTVEIKKKEASKKRAVAIEKK
ncbi:Hsp20/alpha crystallin family protein [Breznakiella homolactica]|uniref:Hsp20/alpha crystallin family protein n=1 Tax=Breznakiella homolactica TaxID=2798577 RepID=A0A7T8B8Z5_9SPIR|nr:Hsp20/alpha crystallin family protein [Breznakiella homolactica]QQO07821.1 Hsp20/alpha crystallin family protein [Breznakiella homolactica]